MKKVVMVSLVILFLSGFSSYASEYIAGTSKSINNAAEDRDSVSNVGIVFAYRGYNTPQPTCVYIMEVAMVEANGIIWYGIMLNLIDGRGLFSGWMPIFPNSLNIAPYQVRFYNNNMLATVRGGGKTEYFYYIGQESNNYSGISGDSNNEIDFD